MNTYPIARPMKRADLFAHANKVREIFGLASVPLLPIVELTEIGLTNALPGFGIDIVEVDDLTKSIYAEYLPDHKLLRIREDVYERAIRGVPRDRFTLAHEFAHAVLHTDTRLHRQHVSSRPVAYCCPEWQANTFAGELLVPFNLYNQIGDPADACTVFGVSSVVIDKQVKAWTREGLLK